MLEGILFTDKRFDARNDNNLMSPITKNTIILCNNYNLMNSLTEEIINTVNGKAEYNDYSCDEDDVGKAKYELFFGLQRVIDINGQKITLSLEPAIIHKAQTIDDIWFFDSIGEGEDYEEFIYPMTVFIGSNVLWDRGLSVVYKTIANGQYGCYDGKWVNIKEDINEMGET